MFHYRVQVITPVNLDSLAAHFGDRRHQLLRKDYLGHVRIVQSYYGLASHGYAANSCACPISLYRLSRSTGTRPASTIMSCIS